MSCCATPHKGAYNNISANFICLCFSVLSLFVSYLSCSFCNSSVYQKVCFTAFVKGYGSEKGRGIPLPFSVFWFLLSHHKRNVLLFFPWKRNTLPSSWKRCRFFPAYHSRGTMVLFSLWRKVPKSAFCGSHSDP